MTHKRTIFLLMLLILFLILPLFHPVKPQTTLLSNPPPELKILNGVTLSINGDPALGTAASSGNGSAANPYIIKNKFINASGAGTHGISIRNTNAYFILRNCTVTNAYTPYYAVYFYNVTHARLENINASNNHGVAIALNSSILITLVGTIANNNYYAGIWLWRCLYNNLTATTVNENNYGLELDCSNYTTISGIIANNNGYGINLRYCNYSTIYGNTANNNRYDGIFLALSNSNGVAGNLISSNSIGIELASSNYNIVTGNTLYNNSECITDEDCIGNTLENNNCGTSGDPLLIILLILIPIVGLALGFFILYRRRGLRASP